MTPQSIHLEAAVQLEKAVENRINMALLRDAFDAKQAEAHGSIAYNHTVHAHEVSGLGIECSVLLANGASMQVERVHLSQHKVG